ncbi:MAG: short-chain dehydrogenase [Proteobacteria bacterium]|nr:MAG: short-chain dehydrogenase [Pseudomonadota bacterium]
MAATHIPTNKTAIMSKVSPEQFVFQVPLYDELNYVEQTEPFLEDIIFFNGKIDGPCILCGKDTTYSRYGHIPNAWDLDNILEADRTFGFNLRCVRNETHIIEILYKIVPSRNVLFKIGQYPSIASLSKGEIDKYRKILGSKFSELNRAVGLVSHGVGIGSFVYLRRIFEHLINQAKVKASSEAGWNEDDYQKARMDDKIAILKNFLPAFLVKNRSLYGVLSKGVHELTEQECLDIFPAVKLAIELILDEEIKKKEEEEKVKHAEKLLSDISSKLKSGTA